MQPAGPAAAGVTRSDQESSGSDCLAESILSHDSQRELASFTPGLCYGRRAGPSGAHVGMWPRAAAVTRRTLALVPQLLRATGAAAAAAAESTEALSTSKVTLHIERMPLLQVLALIFSVCRDLYDFFIFGDVFLCLLEYCWRRVHVQCHDDVVIVR